MNYKNKLKHGKRKHGKIIENMSPYYDHIDLRGIDNMDDDLFAYYMTNVKEVNMQSITESYPELTTDARFLQLMAQLAQLEEKIYDARR